MILHSSWIALLCFVPMFAAVSVTRTQVLIMGAGAAGVAAAERLHEQNMTDFVLVDAQSFIGGRVQNAAFGGNHVELGANWIYGKGNNPIHKMALEHGLQMVPSDKNNVAFFDAQGPVNTVQGRAVYDAFESIMADLVSYAEQRMRRGQVDISGRSGLKMINWRPKTPMEEAVEYFWIDWELAEPAEVASLDYATATADMLEGHYPGGNEFVVDPRGFNHILKSEAAKFLAANDPRLWLNTRIKDIIYGDTNVTVVTDTGDQIIADYAICTFSVGVLQSDDIRFMPPLPDWKRESLYTFHLATYTKIFLRFETQFWPGDWQFGLYANNATRGYFTVWQNLNAPGYLVNDNILMVTTTHSESERIEKMDKEEVLAEIMVVLRGMFGQGIPNAVEIMYPRWHSNPLFRGSYSNWPIGVVPQQHANMRAPLPGDQRERPRLWFAGEATSKDAFGFLHGAWIEGQSAGDKIAQCIQSSCPRYSFDEIVTGCDKPNAFRFVRQGL